MKKIVLTFGIIAGTIVSAMLFIGFAGGEINFEGGELLGYATMIIALSVIFFAIKSYRDKYSGGTISFGKAFRIGLYVTLIASAMYVASWMIISETIASDFLEQYQQYSLEKMENNGMSPEEIQMEKQKMQEFQEMYNNPVIKVGVTLLEILPVGLLISLIGAAILKKKESPNPAH